VSAPPFRCQICTSDRLQTLPAFAALPRATSDSKPWPSGGSLAVCGACGAIQKLPDAKWTEEAKQIYADYVIYHQSAGSEQLIFDYSGQGRPRSSQLVEHLKRHVALPDHGKLLDIGCGDGATLRSFSATLPDWELYGAELSARTLPELRKIRNFQELYTSDPGRIEQRFALVSLVHTLEHVLSPGRFLTDAAGLLEAGGVLVVEVPDVEASPFDVLVADHVMHFSRATLRYLSERCGLNILALGNLVSSKELTLIATVGERRGKVPASLPAEGAAIAASVVTWIDQVLAMARSVAAAGPIGIFGTAIAGMALYGGLRASVAFFVDEDPSRIGRSFDGKPVLAPTQVPRDVPVLIGLTPERARMVADRCRSFGFRCILPPPFVALKRDGERAGNRLE
jgi:SAM-dependent methyltransferase